MQWAYDPSTLIYANLCIQTVYKPVLSVFVPKSCCTTFTDAIKDEEGGAPALDLHQYELENVAMDRFQSFRSNTYTLKEKENAIGSENCTNSRFCG